VIAQAKAKAGRSSRFPPAGQRHQPPSFRHPVSRRWPASTTVHVPYKGAPQGITAVMSKEVNDGAFSIRPRSFLQSATALEKRSGRRARPARRSFPPCRRFGRIGIKGYEVTVWFGFAGPAGLAGSDLRPPLTGEMVKIMERSGPVPRKAEQPGGSSLMPQIPPAEFGNYPKRPREWVPIVRASGAKVRLNCAGRFGSKFLPNSAGGICGISSNPRLLSFRARPDLSYLHPSRRRGGRGSEPAARPGPANPNQTVDLVAF